MLKQGYYAVLDKVTRIETERTSDYESSSEGALMKALLMKQLLPHLSRQFPFLASATHCRPPRARCYAARWLFSLPHAAVFGYALPVIDFKLLNTFGRATLAPGAVGTLIFLLIVAIRSGQLARKWA
jgi:hypothetical protein